MMRDACWLIDGDGDTLVVNPAVHAQFGARALMERERRADAATRLAELREMARMRDE